MKKQDGTSRVNIFNIIIVILLIANIAVLTNKFSNSNKEDENKKKYYTGEILKPNHSANLIDHIKTKSNIVISPVNINSSINELYNLELESQNDIKDYLKISLDESNQLEEKISKNLNQETNKKHELEDYYLKKITEIEKYKEYKVEDIEKITEDEKKNLILLLKQIKLTIDSITERNISTLKFIENTSLTKEEININDYAIYEQIISSFDEYETYSYNNILINHNELIYNNDLVKKETKKTKKVTLPSIENVSLNGYSYSNLKETTSAINSTIREKTNDKIKYIINEQNIESNSLLQLNTLQFSSVWEKNFQKEYVIDSEFIDYENNIEIVETLYEETDYYLENENAYGIVKNFKGDKYSFIGILPKEKGIIQLSSLNIEGLLKNRINTPTTISIPKFKIEYDTELTELYNNLGIKELNKKNIKINKLTEDVQLNYLHSKVSIEIDEKGTYESKIKSKYLETRDLNDETTKILLNRPFSFLILDNSTNTVILIGKVTNPNQK